MSNLHQIFDYPEGARIESIVPIQCHDGSIPVGTRGTVTGHCDDGRAWVFFDGYEAGHTFHEPERCIRVVCTHQDISCPANHEQPRTEQPASAAGSEERVTVELIDGETGRCIGINDYRVCGEKPIHGVVVQSWKTSKNDVLRAFLTPDQKHDWLAKDLTVTPVEQQPPAPAAQETGEWRVRPIPRTGGYQIVGDGDTVIIVDVYSQSLAAQIVRDHNEQQSLNVERERLRKALREAAEWFHATHRYVFGELETCDHSQCIAIRTALNEQGKESG